MGPDASGERVYSGAASGSRSEGRRSAAIADQPVRWGFGRQASTGPASHRSGQLEQLALAEASAPAGGAGAMPSYGLRCCAQRPASAGLAPPLCVEAG